MNKCCECANEEICKERRGSHRYCFKPKEKNERGTKEDSEIEVYKLENALDLISCLQAELKVSNEALNNSIKLNNRLETQNKDLAETVHNLIIEKDALFDKAKELKVEVEKLRKIRDLCNTTILEKNEEIEKLKISDASKEECTIKQHGKIKELKAEVEKLNKEIQITKDAYTMLQTKIEIIKSEAVKEFAEKLKENSIATFSWSGVVLVDEIDNLVKEFEKKENTAYDD